MTSSSVVPPELSVVIPVLHEGEAIRNVLEHLATVAGSVFYEVIVVDGSPQGSTLCYLPQKHHIRGILSQPGRGTQMNAGAALAQGQVLLFLHADTELPHQALQHILNMLQSNTVVAGAFDFAIDSPRRSLNWISRGASWRSRATCIPYGDQAIFMMRDTFERLEGYADFPILEDVDLMRRLKHKGGTIGIICDRVLVSARRWEQEGIIFCTLRNWLLLFLYYLGISPHHLAQWYRPLSQRPQKIKPRIYFQKRKPTPEKDTS